MYKILIFLSFFIFTACNRSSDMNLVPVTNNPNIVPSNDMPFIPM